MRKHDLNEPGWRPGPVPETVPVRVSGRATDEQGNPVAHAVIFLYSSGMLETKLVGQTTTDGQWELPDRGPASRRYEIL